jgi:hypothetical protein
MLKKGYFNWLIYLCYAIVLLHNSTPHCHSQADESHEHKEVGEHHHEHHHAATAFHWLNQLFDHHNETISGEEDVFEWLEVEQSNTFDCFSVDNDDDSNNDDDSSNNCLTFEFCTKFQRNYKLYSAPKKYFPKVLFRQNRNAGSSQLRAPPVLV